MKNIFNLQDCNELINRINQLTPESKALWGTMNAAKMLAHCNVTYELVYDNTHKKPNELAKFILKLLVKNTVVNDKPYKHSGQTAPVFIIKSDKDFIIEKSRLIDYVNRTQSLGADYFDKKESHSFGKLTKTEWNNMFAKHLDHHLKQFGV
jgi:hypothetical protein